MYRTLVRTAFAGAVVVGATGATGTGIMDRPEAAEPLVAALLAVGFARLVVAALRRRAQLRADAPDRPSIHQMVQMARSEKIAS